LATTRRILGAYDILPAVAGRSEGKVHSSQVYRALARLIEARLVARVESVSGYLLRHERPTLILVCKCCGSALQVYAEALHRMLGETAEREHFVVRRTIIEALGRCAACAARQA
jgi:Fur family zinc uptake transcriptional regulator